MPASDHIVSRSRVVEYEEEGVAMIEKIDRVTPRCRMVKDLFTYFGVIDIHDRYRQGYLKLEITWRTHKWWKRLFTTILGMICTDAFLTYVYDYNIQAQRLGQPLHAAASSENKMEYHEFVDLLSYELVNNNIWRDTGINLRANNINLEEAQQIPMLLPLSSIQENKRLQLCCCDSRCAYTQSESTTRPGMKRKHKAYKYCSVCSKPGQSVYLCFCDPATGRNCWAQHLISSHGASQSPAISLGSNITPNNTSSI